MLSGYHLPFNWRNSLKIGWYVMELRLKPRTIFTIFGQKQLPDPFMKISSPNNWAQRALEYAQAIASLATLEPGEGDAPTPHPGRGSATQAEAQAAEAVRVQLARLGIETVHT